MNKRDATHGFHLVDLHALTEFADLEARFGLDIASWARAKLRKTSPAANPSAPLRWGCRTSTTWGVGCIKRGIAHHFVLQMRQGFESWSLVPPCLCPSEFIHFGQQVTYGLGDGMEPKHEMRPRL